MKIALIGNMNNIPFSLMRYLRDLGLDAHLFMYENEYKHFLPENDTYEFDKYKQYINTLPVADNAKGLIFSNKDRIKNILQNYDFFIGCGIAPALFLKIGYVLDIFIPYADVIEQTVQENFKLHQTVKYLFRNYTMRQQIKGIQKNTTKLIASAVQEITKDTLNRLSLNDMHIKKYLVMVYANNEKIKSSTVNLKAITGERDLIIFSNTRHHWTKENLKEAHQIKDGGKGQDKLINGYNLFLKNNPTIDAILVLFEYGQDVFASKQLIKKLNIEQHVIWLKLMPRKEILALMKDADLIVNSLSSSMWGGVGWEAFASSKILIQNILQTDKEYFDEMGHSLPFIMKANKAEDVKEHLDNFIKNRTYYIEKGKENKTWFNKYAGLGLAKEYKQIIEELYKAKK